MRPQSWLWWLVLSLTSADVLVDDFKRTDRNLLDGRVSLNGLRRVPSRKPSRIEFIPSTTGGALKSNFAPEDNCLDISQFETLEFTIGDAKTKAGFYAIASIEIWDASCQQRQDTVIQSIAVEPGKTAYVTIALNGRRFAKSLIIDTFIPMDPSIWPIVFIENLNLSIPDKILIDDFSRRDINRLGGLIAVSPSMSYRTLAKKLFMKPERRGDYYLSALADNTAAGCFDASAYNSIEMKTKIDQYGSFQVHIAYANADCSEIEGFLKFYGSTGPKPSSYLRLGLSGFRRDILENLVAIKFTEFSYERDTVFEIEKLRFVKRHVTISPTFTVTFHLYSHYQENFNLRSITINGTEEFRVEKRLGSGSFSTAYLARNIEQHELAVVVKVAKSDSTEDMNHRKDLLWDSESNEVEILKVMGRYLGDGYHHGRQIIVSTFVDGLTLIQMIKKKVFSPEELDYLKIENAIRNAYAKITSAFVIHGDNHLGNIVINPGSNICQSESADFIDFGNSRMDVRSSRLERCNMAINLADAVMIVSLYKLEGDQQVDESLFVPIELGLLEHCGTRFSFREWFETRPSLSTLTASYS